MRYILSLNRNTTMRKQVEEEEGTNGRKEEREEDRPLIGH